MFKVLVVDDDQIERQGIMQLIAELLLPFKVMEAKNGKEAMGLLKQEKFDLLLTDIKMPLMNGLDLIKNIREVDTELKIIILSAFGEFDYAKTALDFNVVNYLLKPVDEDDFKKAMDKVVKLLLQEQEQEKDKESITKKNHKLSTLEKNNFLHFLISGLDYNNQIFDKYPLDNKWMRIFSIRTELGFFKNGYMELENFLSNNCALEIALLLNDVNQCSCIIFGEKTKKHDTDISQIFESIRLFIENSSQNEKSLIIVSKLMEAYGDVKEEYEKIERLMEMGFFIGRDQLIYTDETTSTSSLFTQMLDQKVKSIQKDIEILDKKAIAEGIETLFEQIMTSDNKSVIYVKYIFQDITKKILNKVCSDNIELLERVFRTIIESPSLSELKEAVTSMLNEMGVTGFKGSEGEKRNLVDKVIYIIQNEYHMDIGLDYIAEKVHVSPNYLCLVFKRETGHNIIKYLNGYRMEQAKKLLADTTIMIKDVRRRIGYSDDSYFISMFKCYYGMTPTQYRKGVHI